MHAAHSSLPLSCGLSPSSETHCAGEEMGHLLLKAKEDKGVIPSPSLLLRSSALVACSVHTHTHTHTLIHIHSHTHTLSRTHMHTHTQVTLSFFSSPSPSPSPSLLLFSTLPPRLHSSPSSTRRWAGGSVPCRIGDKGADEKRFGPPPDLRLVGILSQRGERKQQNEKNRRKAGDDAHGAFVRVAVCVWLCVCVCVYMKKSEEERRSLA